MVKKLLNTILLFISGSIILAQGVSINTDGAAAGAGIMLDIKGATDNNTTYGLQVKNNSGTEIMAVRSDGNVGIGTTSLSSLFHLKLNVNDDAGVYTEGLLFETNSNDAAGIWPNQKAGGYGELIFGTNGTGVAGAPTERVRINKDGNVGIGITNPTAKLNIKLAAAERTPLITTTNDYVVGSSGSIFSLEFGASSGNTYTMFSSLSAGGTVWDDLILSGFGAGNIGIGTINPGTKLDVNGAIRTIAGYGSVPSTANYLNIAGGGSSPDAISMAWGDNTGWKLHFGTPVSGVFTPRITFMDIGYVGIGAQTPNASLTIANTSQTIPLAGTTNTVGLHAYMLNFGQGYLDALASSTNSSNLTLRTYNNGTYHNGIHINAAGNVGVGTTSPTEKMEVNGDLLLNKKIGLRNVSGTAFAFVEIKTNAGDPLTYNNINFGTPNDFVFYNNAGAERVRIQGSSGNVGIGTATPNAGLHVVGGASNQLIVEENVSNNQIIISPTAGNQEIKTSANALNLVPNSGIVQVYRTTGDGIFNVLGNNGSVVSASINANGISYFNGGNIGIGTNNPLYKLQIAGTIAPTADNTYDLGTNALTWRDIYTTGVVSTSDRREKKNITQLQYGLKEVMNLKAVSYEWKKNNNGTRLGFIAQNVEKVIPETVSIGEDKNRSLGIRYNEIIPVLTKAIQEQQQIIEEQTDKIHEMESSHKTSWEAVQTENMQLRAEIETIKNMLNQTSSFQKTKMIKQ